MWNGENVPLYSPCIVLYTVNYLAIVTLLFFFRWLFPFVGHMGIAMSSGVIRDFAGPFYVSVRPLYQYFVHTALNHGLVDLIC